MNGGNWMWSAYYIKLLKMGCAVLSTRHYCKIWTPVSCIIALSESGFFFCMTLLSVSRVRQMMAELTAHTSKSQYLAACVSFNNFDLFSHFRSAWKLCRLCNFLAAVADELTYLQEKMRRIRRWWKKKNKKYQTGIRNPLKFNCIRFIFCNNIICERCYRETHIVLNSLIETESRLNCVRKQCLSNKNSG